MASRVFIFHHKDLSGYLITWFFALVGSMFMPLAVEDQTMTLMMSVALALVLVGVTTSLSTYARVPVTDRFSAWDLPFMGGLSVGGLGGLGVLLAAMVG